ncbi:MAG: hypothetical protein AAF745_04220 [Planctomycetota bacterium]
MADRIHRGLANSVLAKTRIVGILDRLGLLKRIKFSPEQSDASSMCRLATLFARQSRPCMVLMFHSSSLKPGFTPYTPDSNAIEEFYRRLEITFEHCVGALGFLARTMAEYAAELESSRLDPKMKQTESK